MATYGSTPGVRIETSTGVVAGVTIGRESHLVLIGAGGETATAAPNDPVNIESRNDADDLFGEESDLATAYRDALANGANPDFIHGIRASVTTETETGVTDDFGTLTNYPIVPDHSRTNVDDAGTELEVKFRYEEPIDPPADQGVIHINPHTGEWDAEVDIDPDLNIEYVYADWDSAVAASNDAIGEAEFGVIAPLTNATSVGESLETVLPEMRDDMKMVVGVMGAEPNGTDSDYPHWNTSEFTNTFDNSTLFLVGPTALDEAETESGLNGVEALGAVSGLLAGNSNTDPIYNDSLSGVGSMYQSLSRSEVSDLRDMYVIPLRDTGTIRLMDNHSTYDQDTNGGWERDFFRRRIVDLTIVTIYQIARRQIGSILDSDTVADVQDALDVELDDLQEDGLLETGGQQVNVYRADDRTLGIDATITPYGVTKAAEVELEINA